MVNHLGVGDIFGVKVSIYKCIDYLANKIGIAYISSQALYLILPKERHAFLSVLNAILCIKRPIWNEWIMF